MRSVFLIAMTLSPNLTIAVETFCQIHNLITGGETIVLGVSGGPDSLCLWHWLKQIQQPYQLKLYVAHLNHRLRGTASDADADFVVEVAKQWQTPCHVEAVDVAEFAATHKVSLEAAARQCRYHFLASVAQKVGATKIAVAHNAHDQAETLLLHLLRGSGLAGLCGMQPEAFLTDLRADLAEIAPQVKLIRPLLDTPRADIEAYCQLHHLAPRLDQSNQDQRFLRNRIRHELLPLLETYNPQIYQSLKRTADLMAADYEVVDKALDQIWPKILRVKSDTQLEFDLPQWRDLPLSLQRHSLRRGVQHLKGDLTDVTFDHLELSLALLKNGQTGKQLHLPGQLRLTIYYDVATLTLADAASCYQVLGVTQSDAIMVEIPGVTTLPNGDWQLNITLCMPAVVKTAQLNTQDPWRGYFDADQVGQKLLLRARQTGDRFAPLGLKGQHQSLKRFMINQKIRATQRESWPLLVDETDQIHWVCGHRQSHISRVTATTQRVLSVVFEQVVYEPET